MSRPLTSALEGIIPSGVPLCIVWFIASVPMQMAKWIKKRTRTPFIYTKLSSLIRLCHRTLSPSNNCFVRVYSPVLWIKTQTVGFGFFFQLHLCEKNTFIFILFWKVRHIFSSFFTWCLGLTLSLKAVSCYIKSCAVQKSFFPAPCFWQRWNKPFEAYSSEGNRMTLSNVKLLRLKVL